MDLLNALAALANFVFIPALAYGSQLALGALGVTLIYGILRFSNFAHGDTMAFGTAVTILVTWYLQSMGVSIHPLPTALLALPVGIAVTIALLLGTDRVVYRFYRRQRAAPVILVIVSMGVMFIMNGLTRLVIGVDEIRFDDGARFLISVQDFRAWTGLTEGLSLRLSQGLTLGITALACWALFRFLSRSKSGKAMRGYVIDGLGAAQFSTPAIIDRLRGLADSPDVTGWPSGTTEPETFVLAACDPANPYGAALPWPQRDDADGKATGGPTRSAGALVVLIDGLLIAHLTRGGKTLTTFIESLPDGIDPAEVYPRLVSALTDMVARGVLSPLVVEKCNGSPIHKTDVAAHLRDAGAGITPKGVRISARAAAPRTPRAGRRATEAIEELSFDDPPPAPRNNGGFRPRGGYRR